MNNVVDFQELKKHGIVDSSLEFNCQTLRELYFFLEEHAQENVATVPVSEFESIAHYMFTFRSMVKLSGVKKEVKRVIAKKSPDKRDSVEFSFYLDGVKHLWQFDHDSKYISDEFWKKTVSFLKKNSSNPIYRANSIDEPFWYFIGLPDEIPLRVNIMERLI